MDAKVKNFSTGEGLGVKGGMLKIKVPEMSVALLLVEN
jgi:hypothetical protein